MEKNKKKIKGISLLELIIAIGVISVGLFSVWALFLANFNAEQEAEMRSLGANLGREGIEAVKNIRDSNWLKIDENVTVASGNLIPWDSGLSLIHQGKIENLLSGGTDQELVFNQATWETARLYLKDGFYTHDSSGSSTPYSRLITLRAICCPDTEPDLKCDNFNNDFTRSIDQSCSSGLLKVGIDVTSEVRWIVAGKPRKVIYEDQLFNWK